MTGGARRTGGGIGSGLGSGGAESYILKFRLNASEMVSEIVVFVDGKMATRAAVLHMDVNSVRGIKLDDSSS